MGRTWKREPDQDDFDELTLIDATGDDDDLLDWMTRPNEVRRNPADRHGRDSYRVLPDDWRDFDYGSDSADTIRY